MRARASSWCSDGAVYIYAYVSYRQAAAALELALPYIFLRIRIVQAKAENASFLAPKQRKEIEGKPTS